MTRGKREPSTGEVTVNMTGKESPLSSKALKNDCDCTKSLRMIRAFYEVFRYSMKTSGILEDDKEKGKRKRRKKSGGGPARERRRVKRAEARRATTLSTRSPSPFDTSTLVCDDVREYMGEGDAWLDKGGQVKVDMVKSVGHRFGNNNFTPTGQLQLGEVDRPDCNRRSPRLRTSLSKYKRSNSLESEHVKEDLTDKTWFFDCIPKQSARELLREFGKDRCFLY